MKLKVLIIILFAGLFLSYSSKVLSAGVNVSGFVNNSIAGTKINFNDSKTGQTVLSQTLDISGHYAVNVPKGNYNITIIPSSKSGVSSQSKLNQKIETAETINFNLPISSNYGNSSKKLSIATNILMEIVVIILVSFAVFVFYLWKRRR